MAVFLSCVPGCSFRCLIRFSVPDVRCLLHPFVMKQLALIKFLSAATIVCAADVPITQDELVRRTQELYDRAGIRQSGAMEKTFRGGLHLR